MFGTYEPWGILFSGDAQSWLLHAINAHNPPWVGYICGDCAFACTLEIKRMVNP